MKKLSRGETLAPLCLTLKLRGHRLAGSPRERSLTVQFRTGLARSPGWHVGQGLEVNVAERGLTMYVQRVQCALHAVPPGKRRAADQLGFKRRWQQALQALQRSSDRRGTTERIARQRL